VLTCGRVIEYCFHLWYPDLMGMYSRQVSTSIEGDISPSGFSSVMSYLYIGIGRFCESNSLLAFIYLNYIIAIRAIGH
jgi:hypothetical protein